MALVGGTAFECYDRNMQKCNSFTNVQKSKHGIISDLGGGAIFRKGSTLTFDVFNGTSELDIREVTNYYKSVWTCTALTEDGEFTQVFPSVLGRVVYEYKTNSDGEFVQSGRCFKSIPPLGHESNAYLFWNRYREKTLVCVSAQTVYTLYYAVDLHKFMLVPRKVYKWKMLPSSMILPKIF